MCVCVCVVVCVDPAVGAVVTCSRAALLCIVSYRSCDQQGEGGALLCCLPLSFTTCHPLFFFFSLAPY